MADVQNNATVKIDMCKKKKLTTGRQIELTF